MRSKTLHSNTYEDDQILEPLPVYDEDGVAVEPVLATREVTAVDARSIARECFDAVRALLDESTEVRAQTPWVSIERPLPSTPRAARFMSTFSRMIVLHPARMANLPEWWHSAAIGGRVCISRRLSLEAPRSVPNGAWRIRGRLRSPWLVHSIPIELLLWPHLGAWTKMSLEPQRSVHVGRRYFKKGHRVLDALTDRLLGELDGPSELLGAGQD